MSVGTEALGLPWAGKSVTQLANVTAAMDHMSGTVLVSGQIGGFHVICYLYFYTTHAAT